MGSGVTGGDHWNFEGHLAGVWGAYEVTTGIPRVSSRESWGRTRTDGQLAGVLGAYSEFQRSLA